MHSPPVDIELSQTLAQSTSSRSVADGFRMIKKKPSATGYLFCEGSVRARRKRAGGSSSRSLLLFACALSAVAVYIERQFASEPFCAAVGAVIFSVFVKVVVFTGKWCFGALFARDAVGLRVKLVFPIFGGFVFEVVHKRSITWNADRGQQSAAARPYSRTRRWRR